MIFVDAHVHIYDCFDVDLLFDSALDNFYRAAEQVGVSATSVSPVLLLAEGERENWYQRLQSAAKSAGQVETRVCNRWDGLFSKETGSLMVYRRDRPEKKIYLAAGYQIVTAEKIEVLALFSPNRIENGLPLQETVAAIQRYGGIPVLPWGAGKWLGKRGHIVKSFLGKQRKSLIFLGDNGGRPRFWPMPRLFTFGGANDIAVLPGSDPLPLSAEAARVGSFGFYLQENGLQEDSPLPLLQRALRSQKATIVPFGDLQKNRRFWANQLRLRFLSPRVR